MTTSSYEVTHVVPSFGLVAWTTPDPATSPVTTLAADLDVQVRQYLGHWAQVQCSNGWTGWVDGDALVPVAPIRSPPLASSQEAPHSVSVPVDPARPTPRVAAPLALVAGVLTAVSAFLPWLSFQGSDLGAFKIPLHFLVSTDSAATPDAKLDSFGALLLLAGCALTALGFTRFQTARRTAAAVTGLLCIAYVIQTSRALNAVPNGPSPARVVGYGVYVAAVGAALGYADISARWRTRAVSSGATLIATSSPGTETTPPSTLPPPASPGTQPPPSRDAAPTPSPVETSPSPAVPAVSPPTTGRTATGGRDPSTRRQQLIVGLAVLVVMVVATAIVIARHGNSSSTATRTTLPLSTATTLTTPTIPTAPTTATTTALPAGNDLAITGNETLHLTGDDTRKSTCGAPGPLIFLRDDSAGLWSLLLRFEPLSGGTNPPLRPGTYTLDPASGPTNPDEEHDARLVPEFGAGIVSDGGTVTLSISSDGHALGGTIDAPIVDKRNNLSAHLHGTYRCTG
jgi:hypothetical protein